jgi:two-component system CheB/CheR fusion protein
MLLSELYRSAGEPMDFRIFATDAFAETVARASRGAYAARALGGISPERRTRFLYEADGAYRITRSLREKMVFATQDLLVDPPITNLDLITCRNLLIYLDAEATRRVLCMLHGSLRAGGCLFLGRSEGLPPRREGFEVVSSRWHIYRKSGPISDSTLAPSSLVRSTETVLSRSARRIALEHNLPSVLIDSNLQILSIYGATQGILSLPSGRPTYHLSSLLQPPLNRIVENAVRKALRTHDAVTVGKVSRSPHGEKDLAIHVTPLDVTGGGFARLLVSFICGSARTAGSKNGDESTGRFDIQVENDVMCISREELSASREELHALNDELKSSNDRLALANEDLNRANAQLKDQIAELQMQSRVLGSGDVATLFLDQTLRVRWFTPSVNMLFPLRIADVGRPITDLTQGFEEPAFIESVGQVIRTGLPHEIDVCGVGKEWFVRCIRSFMADGDLGGVAITFTKSVGRSALDEERRRIS